MAQQAQDALAGVVREAARAEQECEQADQERKRAEPLAERLRSMGPDPAADG